MATILILIIGIGMFIWRMNANNASQDAKVTQADQKAAVTTQKMTQATTEATTEEVTEATTEAKSEEKLPYTNNEVRDEYSCQKKSDFCLAEGKGFSFYYPKYEFYSGSVNDDKTSFHFASADGATTLEVYREKNPGNAKDKVLDFYNAVEYDSGYNITYTYPKEDKDYRVMAGQCGFRYEHLFLLYCKK